MPPSLPSDLHEVESTGWDHLGRVVSSGDRIFRIVHSGREKLCQQLFESGLVSHCVKHSLIPESYLSADRLDNQMVIEHRFVRGIPPCGWTASMLLMAGCSILELNHLSHAYGFKLVDAHPWNVVFHQGAPCFLDLGSFVPNDSEFSFFHFQFCESIILPLILWSLGETFWARQLLANQLLYSTRTTPASENLFDSLLVKEALSHFMKQLCSDQQVLIEDMLSFKVAPSASSLKLIFDPIFSKARKPPTPIDYSSTIKQISAEPRHSITFYGARLYHLAQHCLAEHLAEDVTLIDNDEHSLDFAFKRLQEADSKVNVVLCHPQFHVSELSGILNSDHSCKIDHSGHILFE